MLQQVLRISLVLAMIFGALQNPLFVSPSHAAVPVLVDSGNGTIVDKANNLIWLKNANCFGGLSWHDSITASNTLANGQCGLMDGSITGDWHLPTLDELRIFVDNGLLAESLIASGFSNYPYGMYSTSTASTSGNGEFWIVGNNGAGISDFGQAEIPYTYYFMPVRGGQSGAFASLAISPKSATFATTTTGATSSITTFTITNNGTTSVAVSDISINGADSNQFTIVAGGSCSATPTIESGASCTVNVFFSPTTAGTKTAGLRVTDSVSSSWLGAGLGGTGSDTTPPIITLTSTPLNYSNQASGTIEFTTNETASFQCKLDRGSYAICTSPFSYSGLVDGQHTVTIQATDVAGNTSASTYIWIIEANPPSVIAKYPPESAVNIPVTSTVTATFDQTMKPASITNGSVTLTRVVGINSISSGGAHNVVLKNDGTVVGWGFNRYGQSTSPAGLSGVIAIAAGGHHTVALKSDSTVVAWGYNDFGQSTVPPDLSGVVAIAAGFYHTLALKNDGTVLSWGTQTTVPSGLTGVVAVAAGMDHNLALKSDGTVVAWGANFFGESTVPAGLSGVVAITAGNGHSAALKNDGTVVVWGNSLAQTGMPSGITGVVAISAGDNHTLALKNDGTVMAWGLNTEGQCNVPSGLAGVIAIDGGSGHSLALKNDGTVVAWGLSYYNENSVPVAFTGITAIAAGSAAYTSGSHFVALKNNGTVITSGFNNCGATTVPSDLAGVIAITTGQCHTLALKNDGSVVAWGNDTTLVTVPAGLSGIVGIAASSLHNLALRNDGTVVAWGDNRWGQSTVPQGLSGVVAIAANGVASFALKNDGTVVTWGGDYFLYSSVISGLSGVVAIAAGIDHFVALKSDGTVVAWGGNDRGQSTIPEGLTDVVAIAAGDLHTVALKNDGTVVAWGFNQQGQTTVPFGLTGVTSIAASFFHTVALKSDGTVVIWGSDDTNKTSEPFSPYESSVISTVAYNPSTLAATLTPTSALQPNTAYTAKVTGVRTQSGGHLTNDVVWNFTTEISPMLKPTISGIPKLITTVGGVPYNFTPISTNADSFSHTGTLPPGLSFNTSNGVLQGVPTTAGTYNSITITATNVSGSVSLPAFNITVNPVPSVISVSPPDSATGVSLSGTVSATFSEAMEPSSINNESLTLPDFVGIKAIAASYASTVALKNNGMVVVWGSEYPAPDGLSGVIAISAGSNHTVALKNDGTVVSWGSNGDSTVTSVPQGLSGVIAIAAGFTHTVALKNDGTVVAWGGNDFGQTTLPLGLNGVKAIAAGWMHTVALKNDGTVVAWGNNGNGQSSVPTGLTGVIAIAAGGYHTLALKNDGTVVFWGGESAPLPELSGITAIAAGNSFSIALKNDGTVVAWGVNDFGQATVPPGLTGVTAIAAGGWHTVVLKKDGTVAAWGWNGIGQCTVPGELYRITGTVTYDPFIQTATFAPKEMLLPNTTYTAKVSGVRSLFGGYLAPDYIWNFTTRRNQFTLTAQKTGNGSGTITAPLGILAGINCGATCSETYLQDTVVALTATPATGYTFASFTGCDSVADNICTVTMNTAKNVTVTFSDTTPPVVSAGANQTKRAQFTQTATATDANPMTYAWSKQSGPGAITFGTSTALSTTISADTDGTYVLRFTATDSANNSAYSDMTLVWDTTPPGISIGSPSATLTKNSDVTYTVTYTNADTVTLASGNITLNKTGTANGNIAVTGSGTATRTVKISGITGDGTLGISVATGTASDTAGNSALSAGPSTTFAVDNTGPVVTFSSPLRYSNQASGSIVFTANETATFECKVDNGSYATCSSPFSYSGLANALHTVSTRATDGAGNTSTSTYTWTVNTALAASSAILLPQTGQTKCYDAAGAEVDCDTLGKGQDGDIRAGVSWPNPRFTDNGNGTVSDNLTGLMWTQDANVMKTRDPLFDTDSASGDGRVIWQHSLDYINKLNTDKYLGHNDWRVPTVRELGSLIDTSRNVPALPTGHLFYNVDTTGSYLTSSTYAENSLNGAWCVGINYGNQDYSAKTNNGPLVWPVRSEPLLNPPATTPKTGQTTVYASGDDGTLQPGAIWPNPRFTDNSNGTVSDNLTGLIWLKNANCIGTQSWINSLNISSNLSDGVCGLTDSSGIGDWRLPNKNELLSLIDYGHYSPALPIGHIFTNVQTNFYWSSNTSLSNPNINYNTNSAWYVHIGSGFVGFDLKSYSYPSAWPVRGGYIQQKLTVTKTGTGTGNVSLNSGTLSWNGLTGTTRINPGDTVTLTATPDTNMTFSGWSGACTGTGTCTVTMSTAKSVTAQFTTNVIQTYALDITKSGTGSVTSNRGAIAWTGNSGSASYDSGTIVTLTATPTDSGISFTGWSGACTGTGVCVVTMNAAKQVTATFADTTPPVVLTGPTVSSITHTGATVTWTTNEPSTGILSYGLSNAFGQSSSDATLAINHSITISGLTPSTLYYLKVSATDGASNGPTNSNTVSFTTAPVPDTTAPVIIGTPMATHITDTTVTIEWNTDEPSTSSVFLNGGATDYGNNTLTSDHSVRITGLNANTTYSFTVSSSDAFNNGPTTSAPQNFKTKDTPDNEAPHFTQTPIVKNTTHQSAVLYWETDEPASAVVYYGRTASFGLTDSKAQLITKHTRPLTGLLPGTTYYFKVEVTDANNNTGSSNTYTFTTDEHPDHTPPHITEGPTIIYKSDKLATVHFKTDKPCDTVVNYGHDGDTGEQRSNGEKVTDHQLTLTNLLPNTSYTVKVSCTDMDGNTVEASAGRPSTFFAFNFAYIFSDAIIGAGGSGFVSGSSPDVTPPLITVGPTATAITSTQTRITWTTDEIADSLVSYGLTGTGTPNTSGSLTQVTGHSVALTNLAASTTYEFKVQSIDPSGNPTTSATFSFNTAPAPDITPPVISSVSASGITSTQIRVTWSTDEPATSVLRYGTSSGSLTGQASVTGLTTDHSVTLYNLIPGITYYLAPVSDDSSGNSSQAPTESVTLTGIAPISYTVNTSTGTGGSVTPASSSVYSGYQLALAVTPDSGYSINSITGCGGTLVGSVYTTAAIAANCTVTTSFISSGTPPGGDSTPPQVLSFGIPPHSKAAISITDFTASDNTAVTGYLITTTGTVPLAGAGGWTATRPTTYTVATTGNVTLYAWAKDAAGNISGSAIATTTVDIAVPTVDSFTVTNLVNSLTVPVTAFTATDNVGVTGYLITASNSIPSLSDPKWTVTAPGSYLAASAGSKTLYAWARDAAGNISASSTATVNIDMTKPVVATFTVTTPVSTMSIPVTAFTATDATGVAGYLITESAATPSLSDLNWSGTAPNSYTSVTTGTRTLYAWAKDTAGNISAAKTAAANIDKTAPVISSFTFKTFSIKQAPIATFTVSDNTAVTGYYLSENGTTPALTDFVGTKPTSYPFASAGLKTLYAWVRDGAGNISARSSATTTVDDVPPAVAAFSIPAFSNGVVPITAFSGSDDNGAVSYLILTTSAKPLATATTWSTTKPTTFTYNSPGAVKLYAWVKDAAGNIALASSSATVTIDKTKPVVTAFTVTTPAVLKTASVTAFSATDANGVTGYLITESATAPILTNPNWSGTAPGTYTSATAGSKTIYGWAKDAAGNISLAATAVVVF